MVRHCRFHPTKINIQLLHSLQIYNMFLTSCKIPSTTKRTNKQQLLLLTMVQPLKQKSTFYIYTQWELMAIALAMTRFHSDPVSTLPPPMDFRPLVLCIKQHNAEQSISQPFTHSKRSNDIKKYLLRTLFLPDFIPLLRHISQPSSRSYQLPPSTKCLLVHSNFVSTKPAILKNKRSYPLQGLRLMRLDYLIQNSKNQSDILQKE